MTEEGRTIRLPKPSPPGKFPDLYPEAPATKAEAPAEKDVPAMLRESAKTYEERNAIYGDNYKHFGKAMMAIFPEGLTLSTEDEWNKMGILVQVVAKITRLGVTFPAIHDDSCLDISTYAAMLRELGREGK